MSISLCNAIFVAAVLLALLLILLQFHVDHTCTVFCVWSHFFLNLRAFFMHCFQCFDAVGWTTLTFEISLSGIVCSC